MSMRPYRRTQFGSSKTRASVIGALISSQLTTFTVADGTAVAMATHNLFAKSLDKNGMGVLLEAWGSFAADADAGTVNLRIGGLAGTVIATVAKTNAGLWYVNAWVWRTGAATQKSIGLGRVSNTAQETITQAAPTINLLADTTLVVEGDGTNASDIVMLGSNLYGIGL